MRVGARRHPAVVLALLALVAGSTLPSLTRAGYGDTLELPPDPLAKQIRALEPKAPPAARPIDAYANGTRDLVVENETGASADLDRATVGNALALGARTGIPLGVADLANRTDSRARVSAATARVDVDVATALAALSLGVPRVGGALEDLLTTTRLYRTSDRFSQRTDLDRGDTFSALALHANGVPVDPRALLSVVDASRGSSATRDLAARVPDPSFTQTARLPPETAEAALALGLHAGDTGPFAVADLDLRNSDAGAFRRAVDLPQEETLLALALQTTGGELRLGDLLTVEEEAVATRSDLLDTRIEEETALGALLLGIRGPG